jgi:hypothetical protein
MQLISPVNDLAFSSKVQMVFNKIPKQTWLFIFDDYKPRQKKFNKNKSPRDLANISNTMVETALYSYIYYKLESVAYCMDTASLNRKLDLLVGNERVTSYFYVHECLHNRKDHPLLQVELFEREMFMREYGRMGYVKEGLAKTYLLALFFLQREKNKKY